MLLEDAKVDKRLLPVVVTTMRTAAVVLAISLALVVSADGASPPVIFMASEGIRPNSVLSLFGDGMTGNVKVKFVETGTILDPVQQDREGRYVRVLFPAVAPGAYAIQVSRDGGVTWHSNANHPVFVNRADPRWLSDDKLYAGLSLKLMGRNLDAREYNGSRPTEVRLVPEHSDASLLAEVREVTPYCVEFTVPPGVNAGSKYFIEVRTCSAGRGQDWVRLRNYPEYSDTVLPTVEPPTDPLARELGVSWAVDFAWQNVKDVKRDFGAKGDGSADDTAAIQGAVDRAAADGGGVVFFPAGTYRHHGIRLDKGVVLKGQGPSASVLCFVSGGGGTAIETKNRADTDGLIGIASLKMAQEPGVRVEYAFLLGYHNPAGVFNSAYDVARLTARNIFIYNNHIDYTGEGKHYENGSWGLVTKVRGPLLFRKNFFQDRSTGWLSNCRERLTVSENEYHWCDWCALETQADKLILWQNRFFGHFVPGVSDKSQGPKGLFYSCYAGAFATDKWGAYICAINTMAYQARRMMVAVHPRTATRPFCSAGSSPPPQRW